MDDCPSENMQKYFDMAHKFMDEVLYPSDDSKGSSILVHWQVGMSRSATIVISYIMKKFPEMNFDKAYKFVKSKRPIVSPNDGFIRQLKTYEKTLRKERMVEKPITKIVQETPMKSESKYEISNSQQVSEKHEEVKTVNPLARNYHYSRGVSESGCSRIKSNLPIETNIEENKELNLKNRNSIAVNPERATLERSLKLNGTSATKYNNTDSTQGIKPNSDIKREIYEHPAYSSINNVKNRQIYSSPVSNLKGINMNTKNTSSFNYWGVQSSKINKDTKAPMFEMNGRAYGQIQPPPYK